jgi:pimeloyl-ACP methyl ester carboxylesterase
MGALLLLLAFLLWTPDLDRATLESRYLHSPADIVTLAGTPLHLRDSGPPAGDRQAPALILIHGLGGSLQTWDDWVPALAEHYRVIRLDLPGSGLSPPDTSGDYTDARSLALLQALLDHLGLARATLVGHSIGGRIAWTFAAAFPERVDRLVLIAPAGFASPFLGYDETPKLPALLPLLRQVLPRPLLQSGLTPAYADPAQLSDARVTRYHELLRAPGGREALLQRMAQTRLVRPEPLLARITAPTLLLWGERDGFIPIANAADFQRALPRATLVALPDVGHVPQEEHPERGLAALLDFLAAPAAR